MVNLVIRDLSGFDSLNFDMMVYVDPACGGSDYVTGNVYFDLNGNATRDAGEAPVPHANLDFSPLGGVYTGAISGDFGQYLPAGSYTLTLNPPSAVWSVTEPAAGSYALSLTGSGATFGGNDFGIYAASPVNDLEAKLYLPLFAPGFNKPMDVTIFNRGSTILNGSIDLALDPNVTYVSSSVTGVWFSGISTVVMPGVYSSGTHTVSWNFTDFPPMSHITVRAIGNVPVSTPLGTSMTLTATANPVAGDATPADNVHLRSGIIVGSFDPNQKRADPAGAGATGGVAPGTRMNYTIDFQNTGTLYATNVMLKDTLDADLDLSTFRFNGASHGHSYWIEGNILTVMYADIMLPDSNTNEPLSHGYFMYSVDHKAGLPLGTELRNKAAIYFDFNAPVITNETLNTLEIVTATGSPLATSDVLVYPNPMQDQARFEVPTAGNDVLEFVLVDIHGREMQHLKDVKTNAFTLSRKGLAAGIYFYTIEAASGKRWNGKIVFN